MFKEENRELWCGIGLLFIFCVSLFYGLMTFAVPIEGLQVGSPTEMIWENHSAEKIRTCHLVDLNRTTFKCLERSASRQVR